MGSDRDAFAGGPAAHTGRAMKDNAIIAEYFFMRCLTANVKRDVKDMLGGLILINQAEGLLVGPGDIPKHVQEYEKEYPHG
jgi:hypothetical protein